jgi:aminoglycoside 3-N-acetyltransferase
MSAADSVSRSGPHTRSSLAAELSALGVRPGSVLVVHSALSSLGWVCGGPVTLVESLLDALGPTGTLVVPTHSGDNSDPADWINPPVPQDWWPIIREAMPPFDPRRTPSVGVGIVPEVVRSWPGAFRSDHPRTSFAAIGPAAEEITNGHRLDQMLGDESPLGRIYRRGGDVLLLGVGHANNTSLHLAEYRMASAPRTQNGAAVRTSDNTRRWVTWIDVDIDSADFDRLGAAFNAARQPVTGNVGSARCVLADQRDLVDFAVEWLRRNRTAR